MWINNMNSVCCHRKASGDFLYAEAPAPFCGSNLEVVTTTCKNRLIFG